MGTRNLQDFDISITRSPDGYVMVIRSPDGNRTQAAFTIPFGDYQLKYYISELTRGPQPVRRSAGTSPGSVAQELGAALFDAMFAGPTLQRLDSALDTLGDARRDGLRLRIDLTGAPELANLPWEYLYHRNRSFFLALSPDLTVVRYVQMAEPIRRLRVAPPLCVLAMACSPTDLDPLDVAQERDRLHQSLSRLIDAKMVEIDWVQENSLSAVIDALNQRDYHIFHFMGHGTVQTEGGRQGGYLILEDAGHKAVPVSAARLGQAFRRSVRIALINACQGAVGDVQSPSSGVATSLLQQGIPAVVAMQFLISDTIAVQFASEFYSAIASGLPVDAAVTSARRNVWARFDDNAEWATPVLFLRAPDGNIFDLGALAPDDEHVKALQQEVIGSTMKNLDVDLDQLRSILASGSREVVKRLPEWVAGRFSAGSTPPADPAAAVDALYQNAVTLMQKEQWSSASKLFKQINDKSPGYKETFSHWQMCNWQDRLADQYRRMGSSYAEGKWQKVIELGEAILRDAPSYKDTLTVYNRARQAVGLPPRPPSLPTGQKPAAAPPAPAAPAAPAAPSARPTSLPPPSGSHQAPPLGTERPSTLPGPSAPPPKPGKPSTLPGGS